MCCSGMWLLSVGNCEHIERSTVPAQEGLEEPESFCRLMVTNTIEDLLDPVRRAQIPSGFNYKRLVLILAKYRCCSAMSTPAPSVHAKP